MPTRIKYEAKEHGEGVLKIHKESSGKVYEVNLPGSNEAMYVGLVDKSVLLASSDKEFVTDSFARAAGKKKSTLKKDVQELIEKMDPKQSMWFVIPGNFLSGTPLAGEEKAKKILDKTQHISLGLAIDTSVKFAVTFATKSEEVAKELVEDLKEPLDMLKNLLAFGANQQPLIAPLVDIVGSIKIAAEGKNVTLKSEVNEDLIKEGLKKD